MFLFNHKSIFNDIVFIIKWRNLIGPLENINVLSFRTNGYFKMNKAIEKGSQKSICPNLFFVHARAICRQGEPNLDICPKFHNFFGMLSLNGCWDWDVGKSSSRSIQFFDIITWIRSLRIKVRTKNLSLCVSGVSRKEISLLASIKALR